MSVRLLLNLLQDALKGRQFREVHLERRIVFTVLAEELNWLFDICKVVLERRVECEQEVLSVRDRQAFLREEIGQIPYQASIDVGHEQLAKLRIQFFHIVWIDGLLSYSFLDYSELIVLILNAFDRMTHRRDSLVLMSQHLL